MEVEGRSVAGMNLLGRKRLAITAECAEPRLTTITRGVIVKP